MTTTTARTLPGLLLERATATPQRAALRFHEFGVWQQETWKSLAEKTQAVANGFAVFGIKPGEVVGLVAKNSPEWIMSDLALQGLGAITLAIDPDFSPGAICTMLQTQSATTVIVGDQEQYDKVEEGRHLLPRLERVVIINTRGIRRLERTPLSEQPTTITWKQLLVLADGAPDIWTESVPKLAVDTTVTVEGVVDRNQDSGVLRLRAHELSSTDLFDAATDLAERLGAHERDELHPIASFADPVERTLSETIALFVGATMNIGEGGELLALEARDVQPSIAHVPAERLRAIRVDVAARVAKRGVRRYALGRLLSSTGTASRSSSRDLRITWAALCTFAGSAAVIHRSMVHQSGWLRLALVCVIGVVVFGVLIGGGFAVRPYVRKAYGLSRAHSLLTSPDVDTETVRFLGALHLSPILEQRSVVTTTGGR